MSTRKMFAIAVLSLALVGCGSRITQPPALETSLGATIDPNAEKIPYVDPALPSGNLEEASEHEREAFQKRQQEKMKEQDQQMQDLRRQKYYDDYYRSRYPSGN